MFSLLYANSSARGVVLHYPPTGIEAAQRCAGGRGDGELENLILGEAGGGETADVGVGDLVRGIADRRGVGPPRFGKRVTGRGGPPQPGVRGGRRVQHRMAKVRYGIAVAGGFAAGEQE